MAETCYQFQLFMLAFIILFICREEQDLLDVFVDKKLETPGLALDERKDE